MKGNINISIQVDLAQVICDDSLDALMTFTGEDSKEGVARYYLQNIVQKITPLLSASNVKYELSGNIMNDSQPVVEPNIEDYSMVDVSEQDTAKEVEDGNNLLIDNIIKFMETISIENGLPKEIYISAEHYDLSCIKDGVGISAVAGLPVFRSTELDTSIAEIRYAPYHDTECNESAYLTSLGNII